jgi:hypothetical protein
MGLSRENAIGYNGIVGLETMFKMFESCLLHVFFLNVFGCPRPPQSLLSRDNTRHFGQGKITVLNFLNIFSGYNRNSARQNG